MRIQNFFPLGVLVAATTIVGCSADNTASTIGGQGGSVSSNTGGKANGGGATSVGGTGAGGNATSVGGNTSGVGGTTANSAGGNATGGAGVGGNATGGAGVGGNATGGANVGGNATGGAGVGGNATGGSKANTGGANVGGNATGGAGVGGNATGGSKATTGGASVGGNATGGTPAATTGGSTSSSAAPVTEACPTGNNSEGVAWESPSPAAATVISDFNTLGDTTNYPCVADPNHPENSCTDQHLIVYKNGTRGGTLWYPYTDYQDDPNCNSSTQKCTTRAASLPTLTWDSGTNSQGTCTPGGSMNAAGPGISSTSGNGGGWGSGIGVDFMPRNASNQKQTFNASAAGYTGIGFSMKCASDVGYVYFKLIDAVNDGDCATGSCGISSVCVYSGSGTICNQFGYKNAWITKNWSNYELYFADALQDPNTALGTATAVDTTKLTSLQMQFNTGYDTSGSNKTATSFNCWIDDVHFLTTAAPTPKTTCSSAYTTSGNKIMCGSTQKIFRGVARPSLEWDTSGWEVMPWDMQRIKNGWNANLVRIGLNQDFYMGTTTASTAQIYPKNVARAVRWAEAAGLDVILDLHWINQTDGTSTTGIMASTATNSDKFWTAVAGAFKSDNHVMFELYNEPTLGGGSPAASDWSTWKTNYQALYNAVRGAGANQITILGGLNWAYDLSGLPANAITGTNIVYNTHPYANKAASSDWPSKFGTLAATSPVISTEFGTYDCTGTWTTSLITYMEGLNMSWTAWGWYSGGGCAFPSLISSYDGTVLAGGNGAASQSVMKSKN